MPTQIQPRYYILPGRQEDWPNVARRIMDEWLRESDEFYDRLIRELNEQETPWLPYSLFDDESDWNNKRNSAEHIQQFGNMTYAQYIMWVNRMTNANWRVHHESSESESSSSDEEYF